MRRSMFCLALTVVLLTATAAMAEYGTWEDIYSGAAGPAGLTNTSFMGLGVGSSTNLFTVGMAQTGAYDMASGWASQDGGYTWETILAGSGGEDCSMMELFKFMISVSAISPNAAVFSGMGPSPACLEQFEFPACMFICMFSMGPLVQYTDDGGATIGEATLPTGNMMKAPTAMDFANDNQLVGYIAGGTALLMKTTDGGMSWENANLPNAQYSPNDLEFFSENNGLLISGYVEDEKVESKAEPGTWEEALELYDSMMHRWRMIHDPIYRLDYRATHPLSPKANDPGTVYRTTDGGATWEELYSNANQIFYQLHMVNEQVGWILGDTVTGNVLLLKTTDGGATWTDYSDRIPIDDIGNYGYGITAITFNSTGQTGFLAGAAGVSSIIYKSLLFYTTDGGETWTWDDSLMDWGHPIIAFGWSGDKLAWQAGFDLSIYKYTQENCPPIAEAGDAQTVATATVVTLDGSASYDPDGDTITFAWTQVSGPSVELTGADGQMPTFTAAEAGEYVFALSVTDTYPETGTDQVTITVTASADDDTVDDDTTDDDDDDASADDDDDDDSGCGC